MKTIEVRPASPEAVIAASRSHFAVMMELMRVDQTAVRSDFSVCCRAMECSKLWIFHSGNLNFMTEAKVHKMTEFLSLSLGFSSKTGVNDILYQENGLKAIPCLLSDAACFL